MVRGHEGEGEIHEFNRPSGLCCDDKGQVVIADSKNQRVLVYNTEFEFQWMVSLVNYVYLLKWILLIVLIWSSTFLFYIESV